MRKFNVNVNGNSYLVEVEEISNDGNATANVPVITQIVKAPVAAPVAAPVVAAPIAKAPVAAAPVVGGNIVKSPMPGMILKLYVANGTKVKKGDKILVLEAMKMENDIISNADGIITYSVTQGANVESGDTLASIN